MLGMEMQGALVRINRQRELTWFGAWLPHLKDGGNLARFMGEPVDHKARAAMVNAAWDRVDKALARH